MKIALINGAFQKSFFRTRWVDFAKTHPDIEIFLITPKKQIWDKSKSLTYGKANLVEAENFDDDNYHLITVDSKDSMTGGWVSKDFKKVLSTIKPDIIYHIGTHTQNPLFQIISLKKRFFRNSKLIAFSMRGTNTNKTSRIKLFGKDKNPIKSLLRIPMYFLDLHRLRVFNKNVDCVTCHYPDAKQLFVNEGFKGKISVQTQVGVDTSLFYPNSEYRSTIRDKYNLNNSFVFGSASRFHYSKGLEFILDALSFEGNWKYLLIGSGTDEEINRIKKKIVEKNLQDKVILTGYIDTFEMPKYWNAIDCAIHFPISTPTWIETFSLALVQAMATRKALIGSSSGSVPFQIGPNGCIVKEGDSQELSSAMQKMMIDKDFFKNNADEMYERAIALFSAKSLNQQFYDLVNEIFKS